MALAVCPYKFRYRDINGLGRGCQTMTTAHPLAWPEGWPRTPPAEIADGRRQFRRSTYTTATGPWWTFSAARDALLDELRLLGAEHVVISCNFPTDRYGLPVEGSRRPVDQGVAIYFVLNGKPKNMARDAYLRAEENMRSLTLAIQGFRMAERHGGAEMMERAFAGFTALPAPKQWWEVLGVSHNARRDEIEGAWMSLARQWHPDKEGGSHSRMAEINAARDEGLRQTR
jgi:hypothetical protein